MEQQPAVLFAAALQELAETPHRPGEGTATVAVTVTDPATGEQHQAHVQPGHLGWLTSTLMAKMATCRSGHADGNGQCGHCTGTGRAHDR